MRRLLAVLTLAVVVSIAAAATLPPTVPSSHLSRADHGGCDNSGEWFDVFQFELPDTSSAPITITVPLSAVSVLPTTSYPPPSVFPGLFPQTSPATAPNIRVAPSAATPLTSPLFALGTSQTPAAFLGTAPSGDAGLPSGLANSVIAQVPTTGELFSPLGLLGALRGAGVSTAAGVGAGSGLTAFVTPGQAGSTLAPADLGSLAQGSGLTALAAELGSTPSAAATTPFGLVGGIIAGSQLGAVGALPAATTGSLGIFGASNTAPATMAAAALGLSSPSLRGGNVGVLDPSTGRAMTAAGMRGVGASGVRGRGGSAAVRGGDGDGRGGRGGAPAGVTFMGPVSGRATAMASLASLQAAAARAPQFQVGRGRGRGAGAVGGRFGVPAGRPGGGRGRGGGAAGAAGSVGGTFGGRSTGGGATGTGLGGHSGTRGGTGTGFGGGSRGGGGHGGGH